MSDPLHATADDLRALARKYRALARLRRRKDGGDDRTTRATLRALAREFPGCLRELDTLGPTEIARRARAAAAAATGRGKRAPWMAWIAAYHRLMRAALNVKRATGRRRGAGDDAEGLAREAGADAGVAIDAAFVALVARPPGGRVGPVVLREIGRRFAVPAADVAAALFPLRRPSPYRLD